MRSESHWGQEPTALLLDPLAHLLSPVAILPLQNTLYFSISKTLKFSNHHDILFLLILLVTNDSNIVLYIFKFSIMSHKRIKTFWFIIKNLYRQLAFCIDSIYKCVPYPHFRSIDQTNYIISFRKKFNGKENRDD